MLVSTYPYTAIPSLKRLNMGFKAVYRALQDVFPQVDARLLKAVAIEHSKDADAAVEFVLSDVLPVMSHHPGSSGSSFENQLPEDSSLGRGEEESIQADHQHAVEEAEASNVGLSTKSGSVAGENPNDDEALDGSTALDFYDANDVHDGVYENTESEELIPLEQGQDTSSKVGPGRVSNIIAITPLHADDGCDDLERALEKDKKEDLTLSQDFGGSGVKSVIDFLFQIAPKALIHEDDSMVNGLNDPHEDSKDLDLLVTSVKASSVTSSASMHGDGIISSLNDQHADSDNLNGPVACDFGTVTRKKGQEASGLDGGQDKMIQVHIPDTDAPECLLQAEIDSISCITHCEKQESSVAFDHDAKQEDGFDIEMVGDVVEPVLNTIVTQSGHICSTDFLEEMIEDAKNNKKTLFSSMDSVMNIMLEVELQEKAAQQAREEAARGGLEILTRVEELKEMLQHAKEANGMHAGEVYGEKAILATEARELQSRLLGLSDERDKSLKILDEMRHALEARLAAAEEEIKAAEQVKFEKEDSAHKALAEQEAIMEKVVQESMMLKQEAEENSKLQEFLMDRGRIVDMLQGEISVICQDVKFLKEKFDQRVPLSQSLSSSQTSCKLASSSSSLKSTSSDSVPVPALADECETPKQTSPTASVSGQSPKKKPVENGARDDHKALLDDGWDLFENDVDI